MNKHDNSKEKYDRARDEREKHVGNILRSKANKKIVVAGPGTGKTFLFKKVFEKKGNYLALTFINALVEDLSLELCGLSDVKTLHGFAYNVLRDRDKEIKVFPKLSDVIERDASVLIGEHIDFKKIFHNKEEENIYIDFYRKRKAYYGKYYGFSDIVYAVVKYFEKNRNKIPRYDQIVVDEFQDFNPLEVSLVELLSEKSPSVLVGDDDQAIYEFKDADPKHIRLKHSNREPDYESFDLPFCSRCTRIIVETVNDIIEAANKNGFLRERVAKRYVYFSDEQKDVDSDENPMLLYSHQYARRIPWFLENQIIGIAQNLKSYFSVLVICPTRKQCSKIAEELAKKGFKNIEYTDKQDKKGIVLFDGLKLLLNNNNCNLGWRIVIEFLLKESEFVSLLKKTYENDSKMIHELVNCDCENEVKRMIKALKVCQKDGIVNEGDLDILKKIGLNPFEIVRDILKSELDFNLRTISNPELRRAPIKITTIQGSKGLSADYVFIAYFDDQYFIKDKDKQKILDKDICNFIVTLTRARKKVFLISSQNIMPTFLKWIKHGRVETI